MRLSRNWAAGPWGKMFSRPAILPVGRIVALKTIHTTALEGAQSRKSTGRVLPRGARVRRAGASRYRAVFDVGDDAGVPFLVMEFVEAAETACRRHQEGRAVHTFDRGLRNRSANRRSHLWLRAPARRDSPRHQARQHSHDFESCFYGSERPRVTDFGIAKLAASEITTTGQLLGTPSFMPPEQFTGSPIDTAVPTFFLLGVILYSLATGEVNSHFSARP